MTDFTIIRIGLAFFGTPLSAVFALLIGGYFLLALSFINATHPMGQAIAKHAPTNLTTLGILGTFIGIFIGLLDFDVFAITQSVPQLLAGLKLAFATSILGLITAFVFKLLAPLLDKAPHTHSDGEGPGAEDVIAAIQNLTRQMEQGNKRLVQALTQNQSQLAELAKLPSLMQEWNTQATEWQQATIQAQEKASANLVQRFTDELTPALSKALMQQVNELLGQVREKLTQESERNFTRIYDALERSSQSLNNWQDNFRDQVIAMREALDAVNANISSTRNDIDNIGNLLAAIPERLNQQMS